MFTEWCFLELGPYSHRDWARGALFSLMATFLRDGAQILEKDVPGL